MSRLLAVAGLVALGACSDHYPTEPANSAQADLLRLSSGPRLVECPVDESLNASATLDPLDLTETTLSLAGTSVVFPVGAVAQQTTVELTIPASKYVEIRLRANDQEHFAFLKPIVVTISYARCSRTDVLLMPLTAWYIHSETKELLLPMLGIDNKVTRSVTFSTDHFSGYAIAF